VAIRYLPAKDRQPMPWKNGGGVTREVAIWPPGADLANFDWRISMATIDAQGPFSPFPGVDRMLTVLSGHLALQFENGESVVLDDASEPFAFPGEAFCEGVPRQHAVVDLNVMVRRGRAASEVRRISRPAAISCRKSFLCVVPLAPCMINGASLAPLDALLAEWNDALIIMDPWPQLAVVDLELLDPG
jgi:environmental stress-induced protein Ves